MTNSTNATEAAFPLGATKGSPFDQVPSGGWQIKIEKKKTATSVPIDDPGTSNGYMRTSGDPWPEALNAVEPSNQAGYMTESALVAGEVIFSVTVGDSSDPPNFSNLQVKVKTANPPQITGTSSNQNFCSFTVPSDKMILFTCG